MKYFLKHKLFIKLKKCIFCIKKISFLKFLLTTRRVKIELNRISTIVEWPKLTTFKKIQIFLEFANFYKHFIIEFSEIIKELTNMLKNRI